MPERKGRFEWVNPLSKAALIATLVLLAAALAMGIAQLTAVIAGGAYWTDAALWAWALGILLVMALVGWVFIAYGYVRTTISSETGLTTLNDQIGRLETLLADQANTIRQVADLLTLSEQAKTLLYHDREVEAIREMIHQMLVRQDYSAAEQLICSVEQRPTYAQEAVKLREEVASTQRASMDERIDLAIQRVEEIIARYDWARAGREAARLRQAFPTNNKVAALPAQIDAARARHKRDLLQTYGEAVRKNDVDASIDLLKELDGYLTPQEAAALQDSARGVFRAKLHNLGVQFAIRVTESQWAEAIAVGEEIIHGYPNSRMAHEVRAKMDQLRANANKPANS